MNKLRGKSLKTFHVGDKFSMGENMEHKFFNRVFNSISWSCLKIQLIFILLAIKSYLQHELSMSQYKINF